MTSSTEVFKAALADLKRNAKAWGFLARGATLVRGDNATNAALILLQKNRSASAELTKVALTYGVYSRRLGRALQEAPSAATDVWRAHWRERLVRDDREVWIEIVANDSPEKIAVLLTQGVESILPDLTSHTSDESLRDEWLGNRSPGLTEGERLLNLAVLIHIIGPSERLAGVLAQLYKLIDGQPNEQYVRATLAVAGVRTNG